nr:unnamed protein product [Callosobruchus chinensis]
MTGMLCYWLKGKAPLNIKNIQQDIVTSHQTECLSWHVKFNPAKRFIITKLLTNNVLVRGEVNYKSDLGMDKSVFKRGQKIGFLGLR